MSTRLLGPLTPRPRLFTKDEFWKLHYLGWFNDQRVELIGGEIVEMAAQSNLHQIAITFVVDALEAAFGTNFWVRNQGTLDLSPISVPDPDVAVVPGSVHSYRGQRDNPTTALLIVEVSETTLWEDRARKGSMYAAAGIQDYWILNLQHSSLEVRRDPQPDATQEFGHGYASLTTLRAGDTVSPLALPSAAIRIDDLLPQ
jgi:Uma2 family endonuclease